MFYSAYCILYTVHKIQCTVYRRLYTMYCLRFLIYSELFALFIRILVLTVVFIQHIQFIHTYAQSCIINSVCIVYCLLFSNGFFCMMHTLALLLFIEYNLQHILCIIQFTTYYNTVTAFIRAKRGSTIVPLQLFPRQTARHYSAVHRKIQ